MNKQSKSDISLELIDTSYCGTHHVIWSGGFDSTLLLHKLINKFDEYSIIAYSINFPWLINDKYKQERAHRKLYKQYLETNGIKLKHIELNVSIDDSNCDSNPNGLGSVQYFYWMAMILPYLNNNDIVYSGHISDDDSNIYDYAMKEWIKQSSIVLNRKIRYETPLIYHKKSDVLEECINENIYNSCWVCEIPKRYNNNIIPCGNCVPCKTHMAGLYILTLSPDELISSLAKMYVFQIVSIRCRYQINSIMKGEITLTFLFY